MLPSHPVACDRKGAGPSQLQDPRSCFLRPVGLLNIRSELTAQTSSPTLSSRPCFSTFSRLAGHPGRLLGNGPRLPTIVSSLPRASASANRSRELGTAQVLGRTPQGQLSGPYSGWAACPLGAPSLAGTEPTNQAATVKGFPSWVCECVN